MTNRATPKITYSPNELVGFDILADGVKVGNCYKAQRGPKWFVRTGGGPVTRVGSRSRAGNLLLERLTDAITEVAPYHEQARLIVEDPVRKLMFSRLAEMGHVKADLVGGEVLHVWTEVQK
jgi:hypothetical protein